MPTTTLLLGFVISTLFGALFHLWRGGKAGRLLLYLILAWVGFWSGHLLAVVFKWDFDKLGQLHIAFGILGCCITLLAGYWLSLIDREPPINKNKR
jgi:hypothetical protein